MAVLAIGTDKDHGHLLVQSVPSSSPTKMVTRITGLTARAIFPRVPTVTTRLGGGAFWSIGIFRKYEAILISSKYAGFWKMADFEITSSQL